MNDGPAPSELKLARSVATYGAPSVFGRVLSASEVIRMNYARYMEYAIRDQARAANTAEWAKENPVWASEIMAMMRLCNG